MRQFIFIVALVIHSLALGQEKPDPKAAQVLEQQSRTSQQQANALADRQQTVQSDIAKLRRELVAITAQVNTYEHEAQILKQTIDKMHHTYTQTKQEIYKNRQSLTELIAALQMVDSRYPPAIVGTARNHLEMIQAAQLMTGLSEALKNHADKLRHDLENLQQQKIAIETAQQKLQTSKTASQNQWQRLNVALDQKSTLEKTLSTQRQTQLQKAQKLASEARSLRELIRQFEREARRKKQEEQAHALREAQAYQRTLSQRRLPRPHLKPDKNQSSTPSRTPTGRFADSHGQLQAPVIGTVKKSFGANHKGITIQAPPLAPVIAPYPMQVAFAEPFKNYNGLLILKTSEPYMIILTGLGDIFVQAGEWVDIGQPLGRMPIQTSGKAELYFELRQMGRPINPVPWLANSYAKTG